MTQTVATYATAERDLEWLAKQGRFTLRSLGEEIPAWNNAEEKQAFLKFDTHPQAQAILKAMLERDKREKGGGKPAATPKAATARTPVNKTTTAAKEPTSSPASDGDVGAASLALFNLLVEIKAQVGELSERIDAIAASNDALQAQLAGNNKLVCVGVSLSLQLSEQVLNTSATKVLEAAIEQLPSIEPMLADVAGEQPDDESGDGEGNG